MEAVKAAIQELTQEEWKQLYQWALLEERARREREEVRESLIAEILGKGQEDAEEGTAVEEEPVDDSTKS